MKNATRVMWVSALALVTACQSMQPRLDAPSASSQQPQAARSDLGGRWDLRMIVGERTSPGELWLFERGSVYTGTVTMQGTNSLPIRSLALQQKKVAMIVDTPEGPVTLEGVVDAGGNTIQGLVTYHQGQKYPLEARRRVTSSGG
jgi:hypothetical protein